MDETWRVLSSRSIVTDRWIDLRADRCLTASGDEISPYYVLNYPDWVHVVALTPEGDLVLVRQYRHGAGAFVLELPGGMADASDRDVEGSARRELEEETGYVSARWQSVSVLYANPGMQTNRIHFFLAQDARPHGTQALDKGESGLTVHVVPAAEVLAGLPRGLIGQALHVSGLLLGLAAARRLALSA